jgi:AcrR family transcriptional regulator
MQSDAAAPAKAGRYGQASLARIAARIGISKGVIAYHFAGKDDLMREVISEVLSKAQAYMVPLITAQPTGRGKLRVYIESNLAFMGEHRNHLIAVVEIARGTRAGGDQLIRRPVLDAGARALQEMLGGFQGSGELRSDFDPQVVAIAIRAAIDAVPPRLARDPGLDVDHYGRELADLFDLATRSESSGAGRRRQ